MELDPVKRAERFDTQLNQKFKKSASDKEKLEKLLSTLKPGQAINITDYVFEDKPLKKVKYNPQTARTLVQVPEHPEFVINLSQNFKENENLDRFLNLVAKEEGLYPRIEEKNRILKKLNELSQGDTEIRYEISFIPEGRPKGEENSNIIERFKNLKPVIEWYRDQLANFDYRYGVRLRNIYAEDGRIYMEFSGQIPENLGFNELRATELAYPGIDCGSTLTYRKREYCVWPTQVEFREI